MDSYVYVPSASRLDSYKDGARENYEIDNSDKYSWELSIELWEDNLDFYDDMISDIEEEIEDAEEEISSLLEKYSKIKEKEVEKKRKALSFSTVEVVKQSNSINTSLNYGRNDETMILTNGVPLYTEEKVIIDNGRTLIPLRSVLEAFGIEVTWDSKSRNIIAVSDKKSIRIPIGKEIAFVNGIQHKLDAPARIINNKTYIPLRFISEQTGSTVNWDSNSRVIQIDNQTILTGEEIKVHFIDVGQADSIYIQAPNNYDILIDAGNNDDGVAVVTYLNNQGVDDIEIMVATHAHEDHIGGLDDVLDAFYVEQIIDSGEIYTTKSYTDYWSAVEAEKTKYQEDSDLAFDLGSNIMFYVIETGDGYSNTNDNSVLTKLDYNNVEFLFTGDMEADVEGLILSKDIQANILKVGHHGSRSSTSEGFLNKVNPSSAVICVGEGNTYGHPHEETLNKLFGFGCNVFWTEVGTVVCTTDGNTYSFSSKPISKSSGGTSTTVAPVPKASGKYVGSIKSDKFHDPICRYAKVIVPENMIWFSSKEEAFGKGYSSCGVCKP